MPGCLSQRPLLPLRGELPSRLPVRSGRVSPSLLALAPAHVLTGLRPFLRIFVPLCVALPAGDSPHPGCDRQPLATDSLVRF